MQTATKTRTATSTRVKVAVTVGIIGLVAAAAYGFAFAPGGLMRKTPVSTSNKTPVNANLPQKTPASSTETIVNPPKTPAPGASDGTSDTRAPLVGVVNPIVAQAGTSVVLTASFSDADSGVETCVLLIDGLSASRMTLSTITDGAGTASWIYMFSTAGTHMAEVRCSDVVGNIGSSGSRNITVSAAPATR